MNLGLELNYTWRLIKNSRYFTALCVVVIALGLAQSLIIFQVINNQLLRTLPFPGGHKFVVFDLKDEETGESSTAGWDAYRYRHLKENSSSFKEFGATQIATLATVSDGETTDTFVAAKIMPKLLQITGVKPALGRSLLPSDDEVGSEPVVLLSHRMWTNYYAADKDIVNTQTRINGRMHTVVGVMPEDFRYPVSSDLWLPLLLPANLQPGEVGPQFTIVATLANGVTREMAGREVTNVLGRLKSEYSYEYKNHVTKILPFTRQFYSDDNVVKLSQLLLTIMIFIIILASINVGNLLLVRANERSHELGVRGALGATRWSLIRHILMESSFICLLGGVIGVLLAGLALWGTTAAPAGPDYMEQPFWMSYDLELDVILIALLLMAVIWILAGGIPAYRASRIDIYETLSSGSKVAGSKGSSWFVMTLVGLELIISIFILITNGVTISSLQNEFAVDYGLDQKQYLTAAIKLPGVNYNNGQVRGRYFQDLKNELVAKPAINNASFASSLPSQHPSVATYNLEDRDMLENNQYPNKAVVSVADNYFQALGISLQAGRLFNATDTHDSLAVVVIDEFLAQALWPDESSVLGKRVQINPNSSNSEWLTIVGVVKHPFKGRSDGYKDPRKALYRPLIQSGSSYQGSIGSGESFYVIAEVNGEPNQQMQTLKDAVRRVDRDVPVYLIKPLSQVLTEAEAEFDQLSDMLTMIGILALVLAASGIYAIMSRSVLLRTRDISIKRALGMTNQAAVLSFVKKGIVLLVVGVVLGGSISLMAINVVLSTTDLASLPWVFMSVITLIGIVMLCATYFPARKAVAKEPGDTLHYG